MLNLIVVCVTVLYNIHVHILAYMNLNRNSHIQGTILIHKQYEKFPVSEMVDLESTMSYVYILKQFSPMHISLKS